MRRELQHLVQRGGGDHQAGDAAQGLGALPALARVLHQQGVVYDGGGLPGNDICQAQFIRREGRRAAAMVG